MARLRLAACLASSAVSLAPGAQAASVLQPGATVGLSVGAPLPQGVYFVDTSSYGQRSGTAAGLSVNQPQIMWATPLKFYDTRLQLTALQPVAFTTDARARTIDRVYANSTLLAAILAHDFGNGFGASYQVGFRAGMAHEPAFLENSFEHRGAVSYTANGYNLTANVINGEFFGSSLYADWLNVDLTATRKFGKFEIGAVAFGSADLNRPNPIHKLQRQIAVGGLVGYDFGRFRLQLFATRDVSQVNHPGYDTRGWVRLVVPLSKGQNVPASAPAGPVVARN